MLPDRISNPGPLTYESGALPIALRGPATASETKYNTGYNSRLEVKHFAVSAVGVGQFAASPDVYLIFKHFEFIKHCVMS